MSHRIVRHIDHSIAIEHIVPSSCAQFMREQMGKGAMWAPAVYFNGRRPNVALLREMAKSVINAGSALLVLPDLLKAAKICKGDERRPCKRCDLPRIKGHAGLRPNGWGLSRMLATCGPGRMAGREENPMMSTAMMRQGRIAVFTPDLWYLAARGVRPTKQHINVTPVGRSPNR